MNIIMEIEVEIWTKI